LPTRAPKKDIFSEIWIKGKKIFGRLFSRNPYPLIIRLKKKIITPPSLGILNIALRVFECILGCLA
jgi:hypothetical protein